MHVTAVESTALASVGYDEARQQLRLEFCDRASYHYFEVPAGVHQALLGASSKGSYFNRAIRDRFPFSFISESNADVPVAALPGVDEGG
jgi:hypothetical protein